MKRSGFTMIELIFVIVILGILASVAIPKLAATRDDAKISKLAQNAATFVSDAGSYYASQGLANWNSKNWIDVTNVSLQTGAATMDAADNTTSISTQVFLNSDDSHNCLTFTTANTGTLTVASGTDTTSVICTQVQDMTKNLIKTHQFGGVGVVR